MPVIRHVDPAPGDVLLLVGTMKGAFILRADAVAQEVGGRRPVLSRQRGLRAWPTTAAPDATASGPGRTACTGAALLRSSDDFGQTWTNPEVANVKFPEGTGAALKQIWQIVPGRDARARHALLRRRAGGAVRVDATPASTWSLVEGLWNHPQRPQWQPGGGGLCLHTILLDPERPDADARRHLDRRHVRDRRRRRDVAPVEQRRARRVPARQVPGVRPVRAQGRAVAARGRSGCSCRTTGASIAATIAARRWTDIANGVPSDFGFADGDPSARIPTRAWIVPLESDEFRCTPEGKLRVYRTRDAGKSWEPLTRRAAAGRRLRDGPARRARRRCARPGRRLLRHAQRQAVRLGRRRGALDDDRRRAAAGHRGQGGAYQQDSRGFAPRTPQRRRSLRSAGSLAVLARVAGYHHQPFMRKRRLLWRLCL